MGIFIPASGASTQSKPEIIIVFFVPAESPEGDSANVVGKALDLCNVNQNKYRGNRREVYITFTCYRWLPLFEVVNGYDIIYKQFDILKSDGHSIIGYVIMPNHVHFVIDFSNTVRHINKRIGTMKRFIAYEIITRLKAATETDLLFQLEQGVNAADKKKGKMQIKPTESPSGDSVGTKMYEK